jgi:RND family efflux transporter MFP subunit
MTRLSLLAALSLAVATAANAGPAAPPSPARVRAVRAGAPAGGALVPASLRAARRATISTRLAASVQAVHVQEGQRVAAGQLLVSLADADLTGGLSAAATGLAAAEAHERRIKSLLAQNAATPAELEMASAQRAQTEATVASARANLAYAQIRAPFAGTVQARRTEPGDLVGPGQPLVELEGDALELVASLSEGEARGLSVGATVRFEAGAARGTAVVSSLTPGGDALSHRRGLRALVKSSEGELRSGSFARIAVPGAGEPRAQEVYVPRSALVERGDLTGVFVAVNGRAELRWISSGEPAGDLVPIRAGVRPGETVVDVPGALRDGQAIEVMP